MTLHSQEWVTPFEQVYTDDLLSRLKGKEP